MNEYLTCTADAACDETATHIVWGWVLEAADEQLDAYVVALACDEHVTTARKGVGHQADGSSTIHTRVITTPNPESHGLETLPLLQARITDANAALHDEVKRLREQGVAYAKIGAALGVTRQAAWERFSRSSS